jgi:hypothetical protein
MSSLEWRAFASREMAEIETDVDLAAHLIQDGATNRLPRTTDLEREVSGGSLSAILRKR